MKLYDIHSIKSWVKSVLPLCLFAFMPLAAGAQGLPLIRNYTAAEYGGHNRSYDIEIGEDGTVFVANFEGLLYYDRAQWRMIHTANISRVTVVYRDSKNVVWVGGYNFFARLQKRANGELFLQQIGKKGQFSGEVMEIFEDDGENQSSGVSIQFVASDNNIYEVRGTSISLKKHTNTNFRPGVESDIVSVEALRAGDTDVLLDDVTQIEDLDDGLKVKVIKNKGLVVADGKGRDLYTITEANGLCSNQVSYVAYDGHGTLWGATGHGIFAIEIPSVYSYFLPKDGFSGEVHAITAFDGKIYVGGTNGLYVVGGDPKSLASRQCKRIDDISNICWTLCESSEGLFVATSSGIYKVARGGGVSRLTTNSTTALLVDGDKVYAGEPDDVWIYQWGKNSRTKANALPLVTEIRKDAHGNLWFKNVHGETKGNFPGKLREPIDNLPGNLLTPLSNIEMKAQYRYGDQIWIGGDEILAIIDTNQKERAQLTDSRNVRFCSILMGNDSVLWGGYGEIPKVLPKFDTDENHLHFFYALDYVPLTGKTLYRYRLNNDKWSAWSEKQDVDFLNLPYGSYTLSVQAQLANGNLSETATIDFSIAYPLLMRWYMVALYLFAFAYLVYQLFRYRLKRLQKDKIKLERIVEERTSEVVKQKDEIEEKSRSLEKALEDLNNAQHELIRQEKMASVGKLTEGLIDRILNPMNYIITFSKMSNDLLKDLKGNIDNNSTERSEGQVIINEDDYEDTLDIIDMLTQNLEAVDQYGQNTTRTLKAMEEMLKDRTGGYIDMDLLPVLKRNEEMLNNYFAKEQQECHIHIVFTLPNEAMPMHGNPDMLSKTIMSILGNAVYAVAKKYQNAPYSPEVSLTATIADGLYTLKIRDNGTGIGEKTIGKIFDPFFTTKTTAEAAGVGLYLSREIIQNHGGDISVVSVKGEYTEFTILLKGKSDLN